MGARKIGVLGVPPIGCLPSQRTLAGGIERECVTLYNQASTMFNSELSVQSQRLHYMLRVSKIIYIDIYTPLLDMIFRPFAYGNLLDSIFFFFSYVHLPHKPKEIEEQRP